MGALCFLTKIPLSYLLTFVVNLLDNDGDFQWSAS